MLNRILRHGRRILLSMISVDTISAKIVHVVKQKSDETYTVILELPEDAQHLPEDIWTIDAETKVIGLTRVDLLWHVYFDGDPGLKDGGTLQITVRKPKEKI